MEGKAVDEPLRRELHAFMDFVRMALIFIFLAIGILAVVATGQFWRLSGMQSDLANMKVNMHEMNESFKSDLRVHTIGLSEQIVALNLMNDRLERMNNSMDDRLDRMNDTMNERIDSFVK